MTKSIQIKELRLGEGIPKICVPLTSRTRTELYREAETVKAAEPDLAEWRADFYEKLTDLAEVGETLAGLEKILDGIPLLFTIRTRTEGGQATLSFSEYAEINEFAARTHSAELIDVEAFGDEGEKQKLIEKLHEDGAVVIASSHDFEKTDEKDVLLDRFRKLDVSGADILKMAVMPKRFEDVTALMDATCAMGKETEKPLIAMSMGGLGSISRLAGETFGSAVTFGTVGAASAPGQFPIEELRKMLKILHERL